ncbi:hypothetical protein MKX03_035218 [Papaver bracteatum]|nr:hypothetical protein MKX03_035218 [Papaver bracteatum]
MVFVVLLFMVPNRKRLSANTKGDISSLHNYYEAARLEIDPHDRSYIVYNIGIILTTSNNMAMICHYVRLSPLQKEGKKEKIR